jgi:aminobenzoyl-glutamate utilization protein B
MSIGHEGMLVAGKILAEAGLEFVMNPSLVEKAKAEFEKATGGQKYVSAIPKDHKPKFDRFDKND